MILTTTNNFMLPNANRAMQKKPCTLLTPPAEPPVRNQYPTMADPDAAALHPNSIRRRFGRRSGDIGSLCLAPTPPRSPLWWFGTMHGAVDGVVLAREPISPLRCLYRLDNSVGDRLCAVGRLYQPSVDDGGRSSCHGWGVCRVVVACFLVRARNIKKMLQLVRWTPSNSIDLV